MCIGRSTTALIMFVVVVYLCTGGGRKYQEQKNHTLAEMLYLFFNKVC